MTRRTRPAPWQLAVVVATGAAAIAFVVLVTVGVLRDGAGTGVPSDYWRALWRETTDPANWRVIGLCALGGAVVTFVTEGVVHVVRRR